MTVTYNITLTLILDPKIEKKRKENLKNKKENKIKQSSLLVILTMSTQQTFSK